MTLERYNRIEYLLGNNPSNNVKELMSIYQEEGNPKIKVGCLCKQNNVDTVIHIVRTWFNSITLNN